MQNSGIENITIPNPDCLEQWDVYFRQKIEKITNEDKVGALLPIIPEYSKWNDFLVSVKSEWQTWKSNLLLHSTSLFVLYLGLAFYEYDENTFWPQFANSVDTDTISANQQHEINLLFSKIVKSHKLKTKTRDNGIDYVGTAINIIGVPLSLWGGFLVVCNWALWRTEWKSLSGEEWELAIGKLVGGRKRLKKFLIENRETASDFIQEMHDARNLLNKDASLTIDLPPKNWSTCKVIITPKAG
jgi:hypothetical protein